jgi:hypothetical protein
MEWCVMFVTVSAMKTHASDVAHYKQDNGSRRV